MPDARTMTGLAYFALIKLAGYTAAGWALNWLYGGTAHRSPVVFADQIAEQVIRKPVAYANPILFGVVRTVLGLLGGLAVCFFGTVIYGDDRLFYIILAPVRYAEWLLVIWWFYGRVSPGIWRLTGYSLLGALWSCLLDIPAIPALFLLLKP